MTQTIFQGITGNVALSAAGETANDIAVFRGLTGNDTLTGGSGNDRFDLTGGGADSAIGGAGDDMFFVTLSNNPALTAHVSIDGGDGYNDQLIITAGSYQLSYDVLVDLSKLAIFVNEDAFTPGAVFHSSLLNLDMTNVEMATVRLDGTLNDVTGVTTSAITFGDLNDGDMIFDGYAGYDWHAAGIPLMAAYNATAEGDSDSGLFFDNPQPGATVATNLFQYQPIDITRDVDGTGTGGVFTFLEVSVASAWNSSQTLVFEGYLAGVLVGSETVTVNDLAPTRVTADWGRIDDLRIESIASTADPTHVDAGQTGDNIVLSNVWLLSSQPINFSNLADGQMIADGYAGYDWHAAGIPLMVAYNPTAEGDTTSGFYNADPTPGAAGATFATNLFEYEPIDITRDVGGVTGGAFQFFGVTVASAWNSAQTLVFEGFLHGVLVGTQTVTATDAYGTQVKANWGQIDDLRIHTTSATPDQVHVDAGQTGNNIVLENVWLG